VRNGFFPLQLAKRLGVTGQMKAGSEGAADTAAVPDLGGLVAGLETLVVQI